MPSFTLYTGHGRDIGSPTQLAQVRVLDDTPVSVYTPSRNNLKGLIRNVVIANRSGVDQEWWLFHDDDGSEYDEDTMLFPGVVLPEKISDIVTSDDESGWPVRFGGNFAVRAVPGPLTFTIYGIEVEIAR